MTAILMRGSGQELSHRTVAVGRDGEADLVGASGPAACPDSLSSMEVTKISYRIPAR